MKFRNLFLFAAIAVAASCGKYEFDASQVNQDLVNQNAMDQLGIQIDPNQDWRPIRQGSVTITANADLANIVKVQVLTESPFNNEEALVLCSKDCKAGQQVTLSYEAPDYLTELVAACVNDKGVYYIKVFDINSTAVDFKSAGVRTRAADSGFPSQIILGSAIKSFNAERTEASLSSEYHNVINYDKPEGTNGRNRWYTVWNDGSWLNDRLWSHETVAGDGGWSIENGTIMRRVSDAGDLATVKKYVEDNIKKTGGTNTLNGNKANNWQGIALGTAYFTVDNNYLTSDGTPTILIPVQMNTTEGHFNSIYYYYFDPAKVKTAEDIKKLPKFKAINGYKGGTTFKREKEYLLPYYGDSPEEGMWASPIIPKGYKIGFLNRKDYNNLGDMVNCASGCTYGDGRLNVEVNHLFGHYFTSIDKQYAQDIIIDNPSGKNKQTKNGLATNGMDWDSPRIGVFSANNRTYLCFEDGADLNFCDMIIEVKQGTEIISETVSPKVEAIAYTMCFEDRPAQADYDMNDVVLTAERYSDTQVKLTLLACGAQDEVILQGTNSSVFDGKDIHEILNIPEGQHFANTQIGGYTCDGVSDIINIGNMTIEEYLVGISIKNLVTGFTVSMPKPKESPFAIIVPMYFNYPKERTSIKTAYPDFINWAADMNASKDWYRSSEGIDRYPALFLRK